MATDAMPAKATVPADVLRAMWSCRIALAPGVTLAGEAAAHLYVPRRNPLERWVARLLHHGETRIRVEIPKQARGGIRRIAVAGQHGVSVPDLLADSLPHQPVSRPASLDLDDPALVSFLTFLATLVKAGVLVQTPRK